VVASSSCIVALVFFLILIICFAAASNKIQISSSNFTKTLDDLTAPPEGSEACHHLVGIKKTLDDAMKKVRSEAPKSCGPAGERRIMPIVMSRMSRGGKTTVARRLFEEVKKEEKFCSICISFNGNANFEHRDNETHEHAILRRIAVQFTDEQNDIDFDVDKRTLLDYIDAQSNGRNVVLIIDELNALSETPDQSAANLLRSEFLDKEKRYLAITTHIPMDVDRKYPASAVIGERNNESGIISDRGVYSIHMPLSVDLEQLRGMSEACSALTPFEAVFYGGIPSVIFSIKGNQFFPSHRVHNLIDRVCSRDIAVESFLEWVLMGSCRDPNLKVFYRFGTVLPSAVHQFPLCYINALLVIWFDQKCFSALYDRIVTYGAEVQTGMDWETVVQYAVMMRCVYSCKNRDDSGPFDILPSARKRTKFRFIAVPGEHETVDSLIAYVEGELVHCTDPTLVMVNSQFAKFPTFDGLVWYHDPASSPVCPPIVGYQCKLGRSGTNWNVPDSVRKGVLIRGKPRVSTFRKQKWEYFSDTQVKEFVGSSLEPLIPTNWPKLNEEKTKK
jgi:hypothetical protein